LSITSVQNVLHWN